MTLKPFDLTAALAGAPVQTRDGRKVERIVHVDFACPGSRVVAKIEGVAGSEGYTEKGVYIDGEEWEYDLFMAPTIRTVYMNLAEHGDGSLYGYVFPTANEARAASSGGCLLRVAQPVEIEL